jgi:branched-chain amino acid transport system ATP-binding protein
MSFFRADDLSISFGGIRALSGLSLSVARGEVFAIIGPNGAGKTTLFNAVTRVLDVESGTISIDGVDITRLPRHQIVHHGIARTFQNIELFERATVLENLLLGRHRYPAGNLFSQLLFTPAVRRAEVAAREKAEDIIELLELQPYRHAPVSGLPYGVRKVVELGRALATDPRLLLLDEPASGLNPEETRDLSFWIEDMRSDLDMTVIMIEHDMSLVSEVADRVLVMNQGCLLGEGTPDEVRRNPDVIAAYLGG